MIDFAGQKFLPRLGFLMFADIARDLRGADDGAVRIFDRRNTERNFNQAAVFANPNRFVMIDPLTTTDTIKDFWLLIVTIFRDEKHDRLADHLFGGIAEEPLRANVPTLDDAV